MKKYYSLLLALLGIVAGRAQSVYFPSQEGMTLEYAYKNAKGIGEIKTVNYDKKGKVSTSRELVKLSN